eukprot:gnl/Dysnectes_brevis/5012_a7018_881.p1 GENE.gnl/Dysnectes_brevis/5012_a7018_881~~gnl/Dysnectes_brevis/5012_a7018_881.p1  ORF type:complete len:178 (+),score=15.30 gnl/Dysnectes_brevis/5012_a7018_881:72-605(+)
MIILIGGVSCSGKSTLAKRLLELNPSFLLLNMDTFYFLQADDWDHPSAFNIEAINQAIIDALNTHDTIIVEGLYALTHLSIPKDVPVLSILLDVPKEIARARREVRNRVQALDESWDADTPETFDVRVWPSFCKHTLPHIKAVEGLLMLQAGSPTEHLAQQVQQHLHSTLTVTVTDS